MDTVSETVGGIVNTTSEAISGAVENVTLPDMSMDGVVNATQDFVSGVVNTTSNMIPDWNDTLGIIAESGLGPVIPSESNETATPETLPELSGSTVAPETLPAGTTVAPETLPAETGSTVSTGGTSAAETDEGEEDHDGHDHGEETEEEDELLDEPDSDDVNGSVAHSFLIPTVMSVASMTFVLNVL